MAQLLPMRTLVAIGSTTAPIALGTVAAPITAIFVLPVREPAILGRLFINTETAANLDTLQVSNVVHNNISYCTGATPASVYTSDAIGSPKFGVPISVNDQLQVEIQSVGAACLGVQVAFSVL